MRKIRVLIVDDSPLARGLLRDFLESEPDMEVAGEAGNGREAVRLAGSLAPDVITMDLEMPVMHGLAAIEAIMCSRAVPILVVSSVADAKNALDAVGRGALEVMSKPEYTPEAAAQFVSKVRLLAGVSVITRLRPRESPARPETVVSPSVSVSAPAPARGAVAAPNLTGFARIVAIASSTGGPQALARILPNLPPEFPWPVVVAQHIADGFAAGMAAWLGSLCRLPVRLAEDGEALRPGVIYVSPSERHLSVLATRRLALAGRGAQDIFHPCCDVLLRSVGEVFGRQAIGIILTGMSSDGAKGLGHIRARGGVTIAQDEATSVIYGMNRVAIEAGAVGQVLPVDAIAEVLLRLAGVQPASMGVPA